MADVAYIMNQSLSPTKLDPRNPISPSKYPDKRSMVNAYKRTVQQVLDSPDDRSKLHRILKEFHRSLVVEDLMEKLRPILNHPRRRKLYLALRPLIPSRLRAEYNSLIPHIPSYEKKVVHLKQTGARSMGFNIRGGKEFGCGVFVSNVIPSSKSNQAGLKVGDEIVRINSLILSESTHEEVVNIMKLKKSLTLTIKCVGMIPEQDVVGNITWKEVEERKSRGPMNPMRKLNSAILRSSKKIQVTLNEGETLGVSIKTTSDKSNGVFVSELIPNSKAYEHGIKIGDEIIEVNGQSLINIPHKEAIKMLKSSHSLMLTIRNRDPSMSAHMMQQGYDPLSNPPEDFEMNPHDFDMDAELIPTDMDASYGFMLRSRDGQDPAARSQNTGANQAPQYAGYKKRFSLTDMEMEQNTNAPLIAEPAAYGFGPSVAMPALLGMMPEMPNMEETDGEEEEEGGEGEASLLRFLEEAKRHFTPQQMRAVRESMAFPDLGSGGEVRLDASYFAGSSRSPEHQHQQQFGIPPPAPPKAPPPTAPKPTRTAGGADFSSYQFPVDDDDEPEPEEGVAEQQRNSAFKKEGMAKKKTPAFRDNVEIIDVRSSMSSNSAENIDSVHPSNMEFSERVLQGRRVMFHTVPKDGPIKIAIRGGIDTPLGGAIIISRILEGGSADRYGRLNVGDQILVCDGVSLINVTHDEAAQALKKAMDMDSRSIDLVVAVNPDAISTDGPSPPTPQTMWPPQQDTVFDEHPAAMAKGYDYSKSSHRAHSGFTMRGGEKGNAGGPHSFLPQN